MSVNAAALAVRDAAEAFLTAVTALASVLEDDDAANDLLADASNARIHAAEMLESLEISHVSDDFISFDDYLSTLSDEVKRLLNQDEE